MVAAVLTGVCAVFSGCSGQKDENSAVKITFLNSKGEIQEALENAAKEYSKAKGVTLEIIACDGGQVPYTKVTTMYNSGTPPTMAMLDTADIIALGKEYALDLSGEKWVSEVPRSQLMYTEGALYGFPFCIEGRGIIYNKKTIEGVIGHDFDPKTINSLDSFRALLKEMAAKGMSHPVILSKEDWSLGAHQLGYVYDTFDGTSEGAAKMIASLKDGKSLAEYPRYTQFLDTLELLMEYNQAFEDPLGADYDQASLDIASGKAAFWANGSWAWMDIENAGADKSDGYGFIPFALGNDTADFANNCVQAAATKLVMIDRFGSSEAQQQAARDFLNYLVFEKEGQSLLVNGCSIIPAALNNSFEQEGPLGADIVSRMTEGKVYTSMFIAPSDHWSKTGVLLQKFISKKSSREELTKDLNAYWKSQK